MSAVYGESDMMNGARTADDATGHAMSIMAAASAGDKYMNAWASTKWIENKLDMPPAPHSLQEMYMIHDAMQVSRIIAFRDGVMYARDSSPGSCKLLVPYTLSMSVLAQDHALAESAFGGLAGYKLGAVGVIPGEVAISAPLFKRFVVDAAEGQVSAAAINMHNLEAEVGVIMGKDLPPKPDGSLYSTDECWDAVDSVFPVIEMCGRRSSAECIAAQVSTNESCGASHNGHSSVCARVLRP
jgi:hypothetical protein